MIARVRPLVSAVTLLGILVISVAARAQQPIEYVYDAVGRLIGVIDPAADTAVYLYDAVGNLLSIARYSSSTVSVIAVSPMNGPVGTTVTISGTGFSTTPGQNTVQFNSTAATVTSSTATQIVTTVPSGATTGTISVTSPAGTATSTQSVVISASSGTPTVSSFSPTVGVAGDTTTITGTNYETALANNRVAFNVTRPIYGRVSSATTTSLGVVVPSGATSGLISVAAPGGKAISAADFFVPPSPYTAASVVFTGRIAVGGSDVAVSVPTTGKIGMVLFDGTAGQRLNLGMSSITGANSGVFIYSPDGSLVTSVGSVPVSGWNIEAGPLTVTGTYAIVIVPATSSTVAMTLTLSQEWTGTITPGGSSLAISGLRKGQRARVTFSGTAGERASLGMTGITITSGTALFLKPDGTQLGASGGFGTTDTALDADALPTTGTYTIRIIPNNAFSGNITLTLSDEWTGTIAVDGATATPTISRAGQRARLTFAGTAGQRLSLGFTSSTILSATATFLNPDGTVFGSAFTFGSGNWAMDTSSALGTTGTYSIVIDPSAVYTGSVTLTLSTEVTGTLTMGGGATTVTISRAGQRARYTFAGTNTHRLSVGLASNTITSGTVTALNPSGGTVSTNSFSGATGFVDVATLASTGTYALVVDPASTYTGSVAVTLYDVPADVTGTLTVGAAAVQFTTTTPGQKAAPTFTGNASTQYTVHGANSTQGCVGVMLKKPDGGSSSIAPCTATYTISGTSTTAGTFTVTVDPVGSNIGSVDLNVTTP